MNELTGKGARKKKSGQHDKGKGGKFYHMCDKRKGKNNPTKPLCYLK